MATLVFRPSASRLAGQIIGIDIAVGTQAGPASYATGGNVVDLVTDLGLRSAPYFVDIQVVGDGFRAEYVYADAKIKLYDLRDATAGNIGAEATNAADLSALSMRILCLAQA